MRLVHADGKVTKCGAKVVKNVTGYDLNKLYIGSLGTLAIIAEATFRLYPIPACEKSYLAPFASVDEARTVVVRILDSPLVPSAVVLLNPEPCRRAAERVGFSWPETSYGLAVAVNSVHREAVNSQLNTVRQLCAEAGAREGQLLERNSHETLWRVSRDFVSGDGPQVVLKASVLLTKVAEGVKLGEEVAAHLGFGCGIISEAGAGIIRYYFSGKGPSTEQFQQGATEIIRRLRSFAQESGGSLVVQEAPTEVKSRIDVWGSIEKALPLMRRLKEQFDPQRILNPGRFVGGI
jgi:glycolate oxidase FAD binding subunit